MQTKFVSWSFHPLEGLKFYLSSPKARIFQLLSVFICCDLRTEGSTGFVNPACVFLFLILLVAERGKEKKKKCLPS